ncbi:MAG: hypothetical protein M3Y57_14130 [Acidobacteriota bacterium]|nr:hypothetical protein [Acidobacteriota bacterium]
MSEKQEEYIDERAADNESVVRALRESFEAVTRNLTPEIEPATVFLLR